MKVFSDSRRMLTVSYWLWCIGFCLVTFDRVGILQLGGFKFKAAYFFFATSFGALAALSIPRLGIFGFFHELLSPIFGAPWRYLVLLIVYAFLLTPFSVTPFKSFGYGVWLIFDLICLAATANLLARQDAFSFKAFLYLLCGITLFLSSMILLDDIAYYVLDMRDGWIGFNQDTILHWGVSRPQAFSYEPSYVAMYLVMTCSFLFAELALGSPVKRIPKELGWIALITGLLALLATTSRSGMLSAIFTFFLMALVSIWRSKRIRKEIYMFFLGTGALFLFLFLLMPHKTKAAIYEKLVHSIYMQQDGSFNSRITSMQIGIGIGRDTHYLGTGLGASYLFWQRQNDPVKYAGGLLTGEQGAQVVMSSWVEAWAELGLPGLSLFLFFAVSFCLALWSKLKGSSDPLHTAAMACALCFFLFSAHWMPNLSRSDVWVWYSVFGALIAKR